jgi:hypothetical protein
MTWMMRGIASQSIIQGIANLCSKVKATHPAQMRELRMIDTFNQKCLEALLAYGKYFEIENSPLELKNDANKSSRNFSSGHAEKLTQKLLRPKSMGKSRSKGNIFKKGQEKLRENTQF